MAALLESVKLLVILLSVLVCVNSWKSCGDTFCTRIRDNSIKKTINDTLDFDTVIIHGSTVEAEIKSTVDGKEVSVRFQLSVVADGTFRLLIDEHKGIRHRVPEALDGEFPPIALTPSKNDNAKTITVEHETNKAIIYSNPFKVEFYDNTRLVSIVNAQNRFVFETEPQLQRVAIALDISFLEAQQAYGIPQHADHLALRNTMGSLDPYRHFNVDYGSYEVISTQALYGAIPVLYAHGVEYSSGVFWLNSAQTWIDIGVGPNQVESFFMSESGALEMFVFIGPTLADTVKQYAKLTGVAPLPQYFTLGYHQSRYSYMTDHEVRAVVANFDKNELPVDVMWLDIDYTDELKYFTWDTNRFPDPEKLLTDLTATNRKLVAIIDPHIKKTDTATNYIVHETAKQNNYYVKKLLDGNLDDYVAKCWPGDSSYLDFLNPDALNYYAGLYTQTKGFNQKNIYLWNDMNEPAVFPEDETEERLYEKTMPSDLIHYGGWQHRDIHNIYGFYQTIGTRQGLLARGHNTRPFILTRSHFAGIQRYAAIWTGDNRAEWKYLKISFPMCLTEALAGVSFCGADVGGFGGVPDNELIQRWYQAGAWLPFYRGHSATDVPRREPYLYVKEIQDNIKIALHQRYAHIPVWYTLFWEHELTGEPVIRPITYHYPSELAAQTIDNEILVGANILAAPVLEQGVSSVSVYLPGGESEIWYNIADNYKKMNGSGYQLLNVDISSVPVFYRGGSIIPRKDTPKRTTVDTHADPYTFYICPDNNSQAEGTLYLDDFESLKYKSDKQYLYLQLVFFGNNNTLVSAKKTTEGTYTGDASVNQIFILNPPVNITTVKFVGERIDDTISISTNYTADGRILIIDGISAKLQEPFTLELLLSSSATFFTLSGSILIAMAVRFILI